jgi:hypothetical protein
MAPLLLRAGFKTSGAEKRFKFMKKTIITAVFTLAALFAQGQGYTELVSIVGGTNDNTIVLPNPNGTPGDLRTGVPVDAPYQAQLAVNGILYPTSITPMTQGYIFGTNVTVIAGAPGGTVVSFQIYIWNPADGSTYAEAAAKPGAIIGTTGIVTGYVLGGADDPGPFPPPQLAFAPFSLWVAGSPLSASQDYSTGALVFSWPAPVATPGLEQISDLTRTNWAAVTNIVITTNRLNQTSVPFSSSNMFYRLKIP